MRHKAEPERLTPGYFTARAQLGLASVAIVVGLAAGVDRRWLIAVLAGSGLVAVAESIRGALEVGRRRRAADEWLLWGAVAQPSSPLLSRRAAELTTRGRRSTLARTLRRAEQHASAETVAAPIPLNRRSIRRNLGLVRALQERLDDHSRPIDPRGILLVDRLVTVPRSPLYARVPEDVLAEALGEALAALEPAALAEAA